jgi:hypothetical protein
MGSERDWSLCNSTIFILLTLPAQTFISGLTKHRPELKLHTEVNTKNGDASLRQNLVTFVETLMNYEDADI